MNKKIDMKTGIIWLIAILAILIGIILFVYAIFSAISFPASISVAFILQTLTLLILPYAGYQTLQRNASGRKLLMIFLAYQSFTLIFVALLFIILSMLFGNKTNEPGFFQRLIPPLELNNIWSFYYYLYVPYAVLSLILLSPKSIAENFVADSQQNIEKITKVLSFITPGWGHIFIGYRIGIVRFFLFSVLMRGLQFNPEVPSLTPTNQSTLGTLIENIIKLCIWAFFAYHTWRSAREALKNQQAAQSEIEPSA